MIKNKIVADLEARLAEMADQFGSYVEEILENKTVVLDEDELDEKKKLESEDGKSEEDDEKEKKDKDSDDDESDEEDEE